MRVAYVSPLPPARSGIADYSAELLPHLAARGFELELFFEGRAAPEGALAGRFAARPLEGNLARLRDGGFDAVLYQLGNAAEHHESTYRAALEIPGVVVLHEFMLHHLVRGLTLARGRGKEYVEEMRYAAGRSGELAARRLLDTHHPVDAWAFPLFERIVDRSRGVLVHNEFARRRILASRPLARIDVAPFPVDLAAFAAVGAAARREARARLGVEPEAFVVGSFGFVTPQKHLEPALAAFARLRRERPPVRFVVAGEVSPHYDFASVVERTGGDGVDVLGRLSMDRLLDWMRAVDIAVNLRHPTGGETSATLMRLLALGVPTIVSDAGAFGELPDGIVAKVGVEPGEDEMLHALFARLADDPELRDVLGTAARRHVEEAHSPERTADAYEAMIRRAAADRAPIPAPVPPLAPYAGSDPWLGLVTSIGNGLADLGVGEGEPEGMTNVARKLVELGLDRAR